MMCSPATTNHRTPAALATTTASPEVDPYFLDELRYIAKSLTDYVTALESGTYRHLSRDLLERLWGSICFHARDLLDPDTVSPQFKQDPWAA